MEESNTINSDVIPTKGNKRGVFEPGSTDPYELSRNKIDLFLKCQRCFWLDRRHGIVPPPGLPLTLNLAVDELLKSEFDGYRAARQVPPLLKNHGLLLYPAQRPELDEWRNNRKGVRFHHEATNLVTYGAIDDLWVDDLGTYYVVDYKVTAKNGEVGLDAEWQVGYKRQVEFYQWLLRANGLTVSDQAWFVYANGKKNHPAFNNTLHFLTTLVPYKGNSEWVDWTLKDIVQVLKQPNPPAAGPSCKACAFVLQASETMRVCDREN